MRRILWKKLAIEWERTFLGTFEKLGKNQGKFLWKELVKNLWKKLGFEWEAAEEGTYGRSWERIFERSWEVTGHHCEANGKNFMEKTEQDLGE